MQGQQQNSGQMLNIQPSSLPTTTSANITTEQIQKYLDENKQLILAILENQNLGKLAECAQYQAQLQKNLMYLAAIADAQPQAPAAPAASQMGPQPTMQQGVFMQQQHNPQSTPAQPPQQQGPPGFRLPFGLNPGQPHDQRLALMQQQQQQQQQAMPGLMGMRVGPTNGLHVAMQAGLGGTGNLMGARGREEGSEAGSGDPQGK